MTACGSSRFIRARRAPSRSPDAAPGAAWTVMQRVDHPDPAAANKQALEDLENGATGLTLVFAGSLNANGYGLDASAATLERVLKDVELDAGITIDFNLSPPTRTAVQLVRGAGEKPENFAGLGRPARQHQSDRRLCRLRRQPEAMERAVENFCGGHTRSRRSGVSRTLRGRRRAHHSQCRRLGSAGTGLCACRRRGLSARARSWRRAARYAHAA